MELFHTQSFCAIRSSVNTLIAFSNAIRLSAHILIASADALIVFLSATNKAATMRKHIPPQSLFFLVGEDIAHCPLTVPSGDTPCLTAGDARRANPWRSGEGSLRHRRCRTTPTLVTLSTLAVRRRQRRSSLSPYPHGFTLALLGYHPRLSMVRLRRRRELCST